MLKKNILIAVLFLCSSFIVNAKLTESQRQGYLDLLPLILTNVHLHKPIIVKKWEREFLSLTDERQQLALAYKISLLANTPKSNAYNYKRLKRLAEKVGDEEMNQIADFHLAHMEFSFYSDEYRKSIKAWRNKMPAKLSKRLEANYLKRLSSSETSEYVLQQLIRGYSTLKFNNELIPEQMKLLVEITVDELDIDKRLAAERRILVLTQQHKLPMHIFITIQNIANFLYFNHQEYDIAQKYIDVHIELAKKKNNKGDLFSGYFMQAGVFFFTEDYTSASIFYEKARKLVQHVHPYFKPYVYSYESRAKVVNGNAVQAQLLLQEYKKYYKNKPFNQYTNGYDILIMETYLDIYNSNTQQALLGIGKIIKLSDEKNQISKRNALLKIKKMAVNEQKSHLLAEQRLFYFQIISVVLMAICLLVVALVIYQIKVQKELKNSEKHLLQISRTDGLTQLNNRKYWEECLQHQYNRLKRYQTPKTSLLILDIDHFKKVNDVYGHTVGDKAIISVTELLRELSRETDITGRYGGEEYVSILPNTDAQQAEVLAERIRKAIEANSIAADDGQEIKLTVSLGISMFTTELTSHTEWLKQADSALYQAKESGRNKTIIFKR